MKLIGSDSIGRKARFLLKGRKFLHSWNVIPNAAEFRVGIFALISALSYGPVLPTCARLCADFTAAIRAAVICVLVGYFTLVHTVTIASLCNRLLFEAITDRDGSTSPGVLFARAFPSRSVKPRHGDVQESK